MVIIALPIIWDIRLITYSQTIKLYSVCVDTRLRLGDRDDADEARGDTSVERRFGRGDRSHDGTARLGIEYWDMV